MEATMKGFRVLLFMCLTFCLVGCKTERIYIVRIYEKPKPVLLIPSGTNVFPSLEEVREMGKRDAKEIERRFQVYLKNRKRNEKR